MDPKYYEIGPGFGAFLATFLLAVAVIVIYRSMSRHLRKVRLEAQRSQSRASGPEDGDSGGDVVAHEAGDS